MSCTTAVALVTFVMETNAASQPLSKLVTSNCSPLDIMLILCAVSDKV